MPSITDKLKDLAREGHRTYKVAQDVVGDYGALTATFSTIQVGGVTTLVAAVLAPAGLVVAILLIPLWPWIFVLPALLVAVSLLAGAITAYTLFRLLPKRARSILESARRAGDHALERYDELRELADRRGWTGNGNGGRAVQGRIVVRRTDVP